jgi:hypothetical protein
MYTIPLAESGSERMGTHPTIRTDIERINDYIIERNPEGVKKLLLLNGITRYTTIRDMQMALLTLIRQEGEGFIAQLLEEHPDYEMIVSDYQTKSAAKEPVIIAKKKKHYKQVLPVVVDFDRMIQLLMFLVCVWLVLKIFKA